MSCDDEHRFVAIEARLAAMETGMLKRDDQIASIMNSLTRIEMLLTGTMGTDGLVKRIDKLEKDAEKKKSQWIYITGFAMAAYLFLKEKLKSIGLF